MAGRTALAAARYVHSVLLHQTAGRSALAAEGMYDVCMCVFIMLWFVFCTVIFSVHVVSIYATLPRRSPLPLLTHLLTKPGPAKGAKVS